MSGNKLLSKSDYLKVVGLLALAQQHLKLLNEMEKSLIEITGEKEKKWSLRRRYL